MFEWVIPYAEQIAIYFFGTILFKYVLTKAIANWLVGFFKFWFVRTQRHIVMYIHFREKAMKKGHQFDDPSLCIDGVCQSYQLK